MTRRVISVLVAVVLAAVGTVAVLLYLRSADDRAIEGKQARTVLVADRQIPAGTPGQALRERGYLRQVQMPAETLPDDAVQEVTGELDALVTTAAVQRGQLLLRPMFGTSVANGSGLAIPDGQMAITARVTAAVFGPASVRPGSRVAIFYTYTPVSNSNRNEISSGGLARTGDVKSVTRLLMTDVEVISVGAAQDGDAAPANGARAAGANGASTDQLSVTFGLDQKGAEKLAHAVALGGKLNIGLLGEASNVKPDPGVDNGTLFK